MSMHIVGPWLTTNAGKKKAPKLTKAKQAELESNWRERNQRLKEMGLPKQSFEEFMEWVHGKVAKTKTSTDTRWRPAPAPAPARAIQKDNENAETVSHSSPAVWVTGACSSKPSPTYTGTKMIGIATMHKSNLVPIFSSDEAEEVAKMRR